MGCFATMSIVLVLYDRGNPANRATLSVPKTLEELTQVHTISSWCL